MFTVLKNWIMKTWEYLEDTFFNGCESEFDAEDRDFDEIG